MTLACGSAASTSARALFSTGRSQMGSALACGSGQAKPSSLATSTPTSSAGRTRLFSTTTVRERARRTKVTHSMTLRNEKPFKYDDIPTYGHMIIERHRDYLKYARIIEWELPKLIEMRKPYVPPTEEELLRVRSVHCQGDEAPVTTTSNVTVRVEDLFKSGALKSDAARRKFLLLAGPRWTPFEKRLIESPYKHRQVRVTQRQNRPSPTGAEPRTPVVDIWEQHDKVEEAALGKGVGLVKISCHRFPHERMNLKWCSDAMDRLIEEANTNPEEFKSIPLDLRHAKCKETKAKGFAGHYAPTISDFPQEWLPKLA